VARRHEPRRSRGRRRVFIRTNDPLLSPHVVDESSAPGAGQGADAGQGSRPRASTDGSAEAQEGRPVRSVRAHIRRPWTVELRNGGCHRPAGPPASSRRGGQGARDRDRDPPVRPAVGQRCSELALLTGARVKQIVDRIELGATAILLEEQRSTSRCCYLRPRCRATRSADQRRPRQSRERRRPDLVAHRRRTCRAARYRSRRRAQGARAEAAATLVARCRARNAAAVRAGSSRCSCARPTRRRA